MAKCEISGKRKQVGNNVSHANNRTKRWFNPNIQKVRIVEEDGTVRRAYVSTKVLKSNGVNKRAPRQVLLALKKEEKDFGL